MSNADGSTEAASSDNGSSDSSVVPAIPAPINRPPFHFFGGRSSNPEAGALVTRYRYYGRLDPRSDSSMIMPTHVVPLNFFSVVPFDELGPKQGSIVTVFSIWNTMMGTALLSMPWALNQAGLILGLLFILAMGILAFYTAFRVVDATEKCSAAGQNIEFADVCRFYFGKWGDRVALWFSLISLIGATIVYWVLMSNFLYFTGTCVYEAIYDSGSPWSVISMNTSMGCDVICATHAPGPSLDSGNSTTFYKVWQLRRTVPWFLVILVFPILNFESPTFFTKFNGLGTVSVFYLLVFVSAKVVQCGVHIDISPNNLDGVELFKSTFPSLTGTLALSYFIHNCIVTILKNQKNPKNNVRDLGTAYSLVYVTYTAVALLFYISFPLKKDCIADNFLNNFGPGDLLSAVARIFLLFQMLTVYPLITFLIRIQFFYYVSGKVYPSLTHVISLNFTLILAGILFAMFLPSVGSILRFVGSASGLVYVFTLPCLVHLKRLHAEGRLTWMSASLHGGIIVAGVANLLSQFALL